MPKVRHAALAASLLLAMLDTSRAAIISIGSGTTVTGDRISNIVTNGSFEVRAPGDPSVPTLLYWSGVAGFHTEGDQNGSVHAIPGWSQTSGPGAYGLWGDSSVLLGDPCADGVACVYFGNYGTTPSSPPTFNPNGTVTFTTPPVFSNANPNNQAPTTLYQTLNNLIIGETYLLDFWTTGEHFAAPFPDAGVFGLSIGLDSIYLTTPSLNSVFAANNVRYKILFTADNVSETLSFTNWGHISLNNSTTSTELIIDDVIVNRVPEPTSLSLMLAALMTCILSMAGKLSHRGVNMPKKLC